MGPPFVKSIVLLHDYLQNCRFFVIQVIVIVLPLRLYLVHLAWLFDNSCVVLVFDRVFLDCDGDGIEGAVGSGTQETSITATDGAAMFNFISESSYLNMIGRCDFTFDASRDNQPDCVNVGTQTAPSKVS
jgi:hypothetical protein